MPYHVRITTLGQDRGASNDEIALDLNEEELRTRFLIPYEEGTAITTGGRTIPVADLERMRINYTDQPSRELIPEIRAEQEQSGIVRLGGPSLSWYVTTKGENVTDRYITGAPGAGGRSAATGVSPSAEESEVAPANTKRVMVVHGRDQRLRDSLFDFLRALGLDPMEWSTLVHETGLAAPYVGDILDEGFSSARAVVVLLTPDDEAKLRDALITPSDPHHERELTPQGRPNVLFEAGMAFGRFPDRTVIVEVGTLRPFSDLAGRHVVRMDNSTQRRQELALRLRTCGCDVDMDTRIDWHTVGDFSVS